MAEETFHPKNLDQATNYIIDLVSKDQNSLDMLKEYEDDERGFVSELHHSTGMNIRNDWFLWWSDDHSYSGWPKEIPSIVKYFNDLKIYHADDMSSIILTSAYRKFFNLRIDLDKQIEKYHEHWLEHAGDIDYRKK